MSDAGVRTAAAITALYLADAQRAVASESAREEEHGHGAHAASVTELLFPAINFAIFAVIIVKYVIPAMREYLRRRHADISAATAEAGAMLTAAEAKIATVRGQAASVARERESIRADLMASATRQAERLRVQAEENGKRRLADAALVADQERRRALLGVRAEVAALATELAAARLRSELSADDQRAFVRGFLKDASTR